MDRIDKERFQNKIQECYGFNSSLARGTVEQFWGKIPEELAVNIVEWYEGRPLSDIRIDGFSIPMILTYWNNQDFMLALNNMMILKRNPEGAKRLIWQTNG